jgi:hypothetical protein
LKRTSESFLLYKIQKPHSGVWLPLQWELESFHPWGPLSAPNTLGLFPSELFSF